MKMIRLQRMVEKMNQQKFLFDLAFSVCSVEKAAMFMKMYIDSKEKLLEIIYALKERFDFQEYIGLLEPYLKNVTRTELLSTSHVLCSNCKLFTPAKENEWAELNAELFDSEVYFFHVLFTMYKQNIVNDIGTETDKRLAILNNVISGYN